LQNEGGVEGKEAPLLLFGWYFKSIFVVFNGE